MSASSLGRLDAEAALRALAHPGRRRVLQLVSGSARPAGELAEACGWTRPATSQHLKVLKDAGLVEVHKQGNRRLYRAREARLAELRAFLDQFWTSRLATLADQLADPLAGQVGGGRDSDGEAGSGGQEGDG